MTSPQRPDRFDDGTSAAHGLAASLNDPDSRTCYDARSAKASATTRRSLLSHDAGLTCYSQCSATALSTSGPMEPQAANWPPDRALKLERTRDPNLDAFRSGTSG